MEEQIINIKNGTLQVPDQPTVPFIEGDGTGVDIWPASKKVLESAVEKAYGGKRKLVWKEVLAGEKAFKATNSWLPDDTLKAFEKYRVGIKGPLTTPVGGGIRSLNVALRQKLDLYACVRPVRWFKGTPSPVKEPWKTDMIIFRENTEDIYESQQSQCCGQSNPSEHSIPPEEPIRWRQIISGNVNEGEFAWDSGWSP